MSLPPSPPYRKLERSRSNRVFGGVCGGLANYANIDPTLVRVLTVVLSLSFGFPVLVYLLGLLLMPEEADQPPQGYPPVGGSWTYDPYPYQSSPYQPGSYPAGQGPAEPTYAPGPGAPSGAPRQYGVPATPEDEAVWGPGGAPWQQPQAPAPQQLPTSPNPTGPGQSAPGHETPDQDERP